MYRPTNPQHEHEKIQNTKKRDIDRRLLLLQLKSEIQKSKKKKERKRGGMERGLTSSMSSSPSTFMTIGLLQACNCYFCITLLLFLFLFCPIHLSFPHFFLPAPSLSTNLKQKWTNDFSAFETLLRSRHVCSQIHKKFLASTTGPPIKNLKG